MNDRLRFTVLGGGYLGTTHTACMAVLWFDIPGEDTNLGKANTASMVGGSRYR